MEKHRFPASGTFHKSLGRLGAIGSEVAQSSGACNFRVFCCPDANAGRQETGKNTRKCAGFKDDLRHSHFREMRITAYCA
jgi:hypothetical protein